MASSPDSLYNQCIPVMIKYLHNLDGILTKAEKWADEQGKPHDQVITYRLIADMRGLDYQVQSCSNTVKFLAVRVGQMENVYLEDNETTFEQLHARIDRTVKMLEGLDPKCMDGSEDKEIIMETKMGKFQFKDGRYYVHQYAIPNFHFHLTSAYCILRTLGVPVGAFDYLKDVFTKA